jgi:hypothetical protein
MPLSAMLADVLAALVRVVQKSIRLARQSHQQDVRNQLSGHAGTHRPTNHDTRTGRSRRG